MRSSAATVLSPLAIFAGLLLLTGCLELPSTQVMVIIDAEEVPKSRIENLHVLVYGSEQGQAPEQTADLELDEPDFPISLALVPLNDDTGRSFGVEANGIDGAGERIAVVRARGAYVRREARTAILRFEESCLGVVDCHPDETCSLGRCIDAELGEDDYGSLDRDGSFALPPYTVADNYTIPNNRSFVFNPSKNDRDPQEEGLALVSGELVKGGGGLELLPNGDFEYRASPGYTGDVEAIYIVANPAGLRARGLIKIAVVEGDPGSIDPTLDSDDDGIPDWIEVQGCTDRYNADTDGDGIPDGIEDRNRNGKIDRYETDPCKADSRGFGLCDGAYRENVNLANLGCQDFEVIFIDAANRQVDDRDGRTWATAFASYNEAIQGLMIEDAPISGRQFWFKQGHYDDGDDAGHVVAIYDHGIGIYGGFAGNEEHLTDRRLPFYTPTVFARPNNWEDPAFSINQANKVTIDGFDIVNTGEEAGPVTPAVLAEGGADLDLRYLIVRGLGPNLDLQWSDINLINIDRLAMSDIIVHGYPYAYGEGEPGFVIMRNTSGKIERMLFFTDNGAAPEVFPIYFETHHSIEITKSFFRVASAPMKGAVHDAEEGGGELLELSFTDSVVVGTESAQGYGTRLDNYRSAAPTTFRFSNLSYSYSEGAVPRIVYFVDYGDNPDADLQLDFTNISAEGVEGEGLVYLSLGGAQAVINSYNNVASIFGDAAETMIAGAGLDDVIINAGSNCTGERALDWLNSLTLLPDETTCAPGVVTTPPLEQTIGVSSLAETSAFIERTPDTGAPEPGFHVSLGAPRFLNIESAEQGPGECGWKIEATGDCFVVSLGGVTPGLYPIPANGLARQQAEGDSIVCFGEEQRPAFLYDAELFTPPCGL